MKFEIERKFLLKDDSWQQFAGEGKFYRQGYLPSAEGLTMRVRVTPDGGFITVKGSRRGQGFARMEYEYSIPAGDAAEMIDNLCGGRVVEKTRYRIPESGGRCWEIDVFSGANAGLCVAEIELESEDAVFSRPAWLGKEVTMDLRYGNGYLASFPYLTWTDR